MKKSVAMMVRLVGEGKKHELPEFRKERKPKTEKNCKEDYTLLKTK
jgi:hypothetical protein